MKHGGKILTRPSRQNIYYFPGLVGSLRGREKEVRDKKEGEEIEYEERGREECAFDVLKS
jgi:hypothetical protein